MPIYDRVSGQDYVKYVLENQGAKRILDLSGLHLATTGSFPNTQGGFIAWDYPEGTGATVFFNHHGLGNTEYIFYSTKDWSNFRELLRITNLEARFDVNILPKTDNLYNIGQSNRRFSSIYLGGKIVFGDGTELSSARAVGAMNFSTPTVYLGNGDTLQLARFKLPAGKVFMVFKAQVAKSDGTEDSNLVIEVYDATNSRTVYSTTSNTVQEGAPLATSNAGVEIIIRIKNNTGAAVDCQGFVSGAIVSGAIV